MKESNLKKYYELRWEILRKPWNQPRGSERDDMEDKAIHIMACDGNKIVGVARLHFNGIKEAQIRYMAVEEGYRRRGIGSMMLRRLEEMAKEKGAEYIILNARENAVNFYKKNGYSIIEKSYVLFNEIQHYKMKKKL
ncbi:MAG: GNAT family N-acetyltransferase [Thermoplasmata archaeon]|nr:GNAT family N-acetyltransferase [Thermoplasmata archaeon]